MIIDHRHPVYYKRWIRKHQNRFNGAYYYSKEIVENIIPNVKTDRNWITVNVPGYGCDHSIVFIHNNLQPERYEWLSRYKDLILVCGIPETCEKVSHLGRAVYLPLSIDTKEVKAYKSKKTKDTAFVGRKDKRDNVHFPEGTDFIEGVSRETLLSRMAEYKKVYAVGRTALEAKALGCKILPYDPRFPDPSVWKVVDNTEAAKMLQKLIDDIDKRGETNE